MDDHKVVVHGDESRLHEFQDPEPEHSLVRELVLLQATAWLHLRIKRRHHVVWGCHHVAEMIAYSTVMAFLVFRTQRAKRRTEASVRLLPRRLPRLGEKEAC